MTDVQQAAAAKVAAQAAGIVAGISTQQQIGRALGLKRRSWQEKPTGRLPLA